MTDPVNIGEPKFIKPTGTASGVLVVPRLFGNKEARMRAAKFIIHALDAEADFDLATAEGIKNKREADELRYHALCILGEEVPEDLKAVAVNNRWRAARTDSYYVVGAVSCLHGAIGAIEAKFVPPRWGRFLLEMELRCSYGNGSC